MSLIGRLLLYLLLVLGVARMACYFVNVVAFLPTPLEAHNLEAKMVLLAYRAQQGLSLYPAWWNYPHVSNFFGPVYFVLVGLMGRVLGADIRGLFLIGRVVTVASAVLTTLVVSAWIGRRYGRWAGLAGGVLSVGSVPMYGFTVMVRPDALAELLGVGGFLLSGRQSRGTKCAGVALLILAVLTKQTAGVFLLAATLAPALAGQWRRALGVLAGGSAGLILVAVAVNVLLEPHFVRSLLGESKMPWDFAAWRLLLYRVGVTSPDLLIVPALGLWLWYRERVHGIRPATLTVVLLASALSLSGKLGADTNYYLSLRIAEAMAIGAFWQALHASKGYGLVRSAALAASTAVAAASIGPGLMGGYYLASMAVQEALASEGPQGRRYVNSHQAAITRTRDPRVRMLTDSGLLDLYQGERAVFGDPWLFRKLIETGRIRPTTLETRIDSQYYDVIITTHDLMSPDYVTHDFRLPDGLAKHVRTRYVLRDTQPGFYYYGRRGEMPPSDALQ